MTSIVLRKSGLPVMGLFALGLILTLIFGGRAGNAQDPYQEQSDIVIAEAIPMAAPLPRVKPVARAQTKTITITPIKKSQNIILASLSGSSAALRGTRQKPVQAQDSAVLTQLFKERGNTTLTDKDKKQYQEILALQRVNDFKTADKKIKKLKNKILVGHVLAQRYLDSAQYISTYSELENWLTQYDDHPQARRVYDLMMRKKPSDVTEAVKRPSNKKILSGKLGTSNAQVYKYKSTISRTSAQYNQAKSLQRKISRLVKNYEPTKASALLTDSDASAFLDQAEYDQYRAIIASGYMYAGKDGEAKSYSKAAWNRSGQDAPLAGWVYGLSLWKEQNYGPAATAFESAATSKYASGWMRSAAAYWAARSYKKVNDKAQATRFLKAAADYKHTFYGIIAKRALDVSLDYNWQMPSFDKEAKAVIQETKSGKRALALLDLGMNLEAEKELLVYEGRLSRDDKKALIALASAYKLPALQMRLGSLYKGADNALYDSALYPWSPWEPRGGYRVDKALVHAFVRQESRFRADAQNPSGATGLMQLMPTTASYIAGHDRYKTPEGREQLKQPVVNLSLGQDYIAHLLEQRAVKGDLLSLAIAYNAGPGNLARWKSERQHIKDPLLFIETIPFAETRAFVERVLANYWIYKDKAGEQSPSLYAVSKGEWALYAGRVSPRSTDLASLN